MQTRILNVCFVLSWLLVGAEANAGRTSTRLTRENLDQQPFAFTIEVTDRFQAGRELRFRVTVRPKADRMAADSKYVAALQIRNGDRLIASCPVAATEKDDAFSYSFSIAKPYLQNSRFTFGEQVGSGREWISGRYYTATLADFAE